MPLFTIVNSVTKEIGEIVTIIPSGLKGIITSMGAMIDSTAKNIYSRSIISDIDYIEGRIGYQTNYYTYDKSTGTTVAGSTVYSTKMSDYEEKGTWTIGTNTISLSVNSGWSVSLGITLYVHYKNGLVVQLFNLSDLYPMISFSGTVASSASYSADSVNRAWSKGVSFRQDTSGSGVLTDASPTLGATGGSGSFGPVTPLKPAYLYYDDIRIRLSTYGYINHILNVTFTLQINNVTYPLAFTNAGMS